MSDLQDRGDNGAVPDPSWEEHWCTWSLEAIQARIAEAADYGVLSTVQVAALLQGLPPPARGADPTNTVLAEYEAVVQRWVQDTESGRMPKAPTPQELAAWADAMGAELPDSFLAALKAKAERVDAPRVGVAPCGLTVALPLWVPIPLDSAAPAPQKPRGGRPTTAAAATQALLAAARRVLDAEVSQGRVPSLIEIGRMLQGTPAAGARTAATIKRLLNGKLDLEKARRKVLAAASRPKNDT